jgi:hypothetical protein
VDRFGTNQARDRIEAFKMQVKVRELSSRG